jgi:hypothetical protein
MAMMQRLVTPLGTTYDVDPGVVKLVVVAKAGWAVSREDATRHEAIRPARMGMCTERPSIVLFATLAMDDARYLTK